MNAEARDIFRASFPAHGVLLGLDMPLDDDEARAATEVVQRIATETATRWEHTPGTLGSTALRARILDEAGEALDQLGLVHWALSADGDVLASGSPRPRRTPDPGEPLTPFFGEPWLASVATDLGRRVADVGLAGTPGYPAALTVRHRGDEDTRRTVAILAPSARVGDELAGLILGTRGEPGEEAEAAVTVRGAAALLVRADGSLFITPGWPAAGSPWVSPGHRP